MVAQPRRGSAGKASATTKKASTPASATRPRTAKKSAVKDSKQHSIAQRRRTTQSRTLEAINGALTAAAQPMEAGTSAKPGPGGPHSATRTWQHAAAGYARTVPELNAAKMYVGNCLSRIDLRVGRRESDGRVVPAKTGEKKNEAGEVVVEYAEGVDEKGYEQAAAIINTIRSPIGGTSELMRSYGEKMFVSGELYLLPSDEPHGLVFECLSTQELAKDAEQWQRLPGPGEPAEPIPDGVVPIRVWRPDEQFGKLATSSVRACLEVLEELVILTRLVRSSAISRMALAGLLAIADEFDEPESDDGEDGSDDEHPLVTDMILSGATAIDDPASAAAWMPYILQGPASLIEKGLKFIQFKSDDSVKIVERREALERLAQGLDLPMEIVLGHKDTTFANAAQISEDRFAIHIEPLVQMFCDAVTQGILWPALAKQAGLRGDQVQADGYPADVLTFAVTFDASRLVSKPDRAKDIIAVATQDQTQTMIRLAEIRLALGLDPDEGPDDDEVERRIAYFQRAHIRESVDAPPSDLPTEGDLADGSGVTASLAIASSLAHRVAGAAELTMERAAEKVSNRIRPKLRGSQRDQCAGLPPWDMTRALGPAAVAKLLGEDDPVAAEIATFARTVTRWASDAGQARPGAFAEAASSVVAAAITDRLYFDGAQFTAEDAVALAAAAG